MISSLENYRAELESAAYEELVEFYMTGPFAWQVDSEDIYRRFARGPYCIDATRNLVGAVEALTGKQARREHHKIDEGVHYFVAIPALGDAVLRACDIVIDPTYLQFVDPRLLSTIEMPNVFIGSRFEICELMETPEFESEDACAELYLGETLVEEAARR